MKIQTVFIPVSAETCLVKMAVWNYPGKNKDKEFVTGVEEQPNRIVLTKEELAFLLDDYFENKVSQSGMDFLNSKLNP